MNPVWANCKNELEKLMVKRVSKLFLVLACVLPIIIKILVNKMFITDWMALPSTNMNYMILDLMVKVILPLFCFIAAAELYTGEGERETLFQVRPISRIELFFSKTVAIGIFIGIQLLLSWLAVTISSMVLDNSFRFADLVLSLVAFLVSWFPLMVLSALAVLIALLVKTSVLAVSGLILVYVGMTILPYVFPGLLYMFPSSYLDWYMQWIGDISFRFVAQTVTYLCSAAALCLATGYYMFNKKEA
jgi:ABC-2 type transport system permease protein